MDIRLENICFDVNSSKALLIDFDRSVEYPLFLSWKRWRHEYLLELRTSHRIDYKKGDRVKTTLIGQVVLIHDENHPRSLWKLTLVEELIKGSDGQVRGARVRTQSGLDRSVILNRPVQHLYPLEVDSENTVDDQTIRDGNVLSHK